MRTVSKPCTQYPSKDFFIIVCNNILNTVSIYKQYNCFLVAFSDTVFALQRSNIHSVLLSLISVLWLRGGGRSLPDACIQERNGKMILWSLRALSNWMLFIGWEEALGKGSSLHSAAHFASSTSMNPSFLCPLMIKKEMEQNNGFIPCVN